MKLTYDPRADTLYIHVAPEGTPIQSSANLDEQVHLDYGLDDAVVGITVLHAGRPVLEILGNEGRDGR
jgi:uncharacterized protein YuzE